MKSRKSCCTTPGVGLGIGVAVGVCGGVGLSKKFNVKVFYVMGNALSGELSCPCDRSCSGSNKPRWLFFLLINVKMPTVVGILTFMSRKNVMLSCVEHDIFFITLGARCDFQPS